MTDHTEMRERSNWQLYMLWTVQILTALVFFAAGTAKLIGAEQMVALFEQIDVGQWFRYTTGALELIGAVLILIPTRAWLGGAVLSCIMVGAIYVHVAVVGGSFIPALVLLILAASIAYVRCPAIRG